jgi:hypothetical protein
MPDKEKINKLYSDIKNIEVPKDLTDADLQEMVNDIGEGLKIILEAIKLIGSKYKK